MYLFLETYWRTLGEAAEAEGSIRRGTLVETTIESSQKPDFMAQTVRSEPTLQDDCLNRGHPLSCTSHHPGPPTIETKSTDDWIQNLSGDSSDVDGGIVKDLMTLALRYFEQVELAAVKRPAVVLDFEEYRQKILLLIDGDSNLDRRLVEATEVKNLLVSNLVPLVLALKTGDSPSSAEEFLLLTFHIGINLVRSGSRRTLLEDTNRVFEQASNIAPVQPQRSACILPNNVLDFVDATESEIKSRINNISDLMFTTRHRVVSFDEEPPPQVGGSRPYKRSLFDQDKVFHGVGRQSKRSRSASTSVVGSSSTSQGTENSAIPYSGLSKSSSMHSTRSTNSPSVLPEFSDDGSHSHIRPSTYTATSASPSEGRRSYSEVLRSASTRPSTNCKNCNAFLNE